MPVRETSRNAYDALRESGRMGESYETIMSAVKRRPKRGVTRKELEGLTGFGANQVSGRVKELLKRKRLREDGVRVNKESGRPANVLKIAEEG